ncbi:MAG: hypothetical protein J6K92_00680 [Oscillospiraceae bacterium]|nr:hypothetical protein [Oscillospiraceae bacterium]
MAQAAVFSLGIEILDSPLKKFGNVRVKRSCDGVGMSGLCISQISFDVPGELYAVRAAKTVVKGVNGLPTFYIDDRHKSRGVYSVTCLDRLAFADIDFPYSSFLEGEGPLPIADVVQNIINVVKFKGLTGIPAWLTEIPREKLQGSCSDILSFIAECCCGFFYMTDDDVCTFAPFGSFSSTMSVSKHTALDIGIDYSPNGILCTDGNGRQYSRGGVGYSFDTVQINSDLISNEGCEEIWKRIDGKTYTQYSCDTCILPSVPYPAVKISYAQGYELITQDINCEITKNGIFGSLRGNAPSDGEIGSRHRLTRNRVEYGKKCGNIINSKYQGIIVVDDEE